MSLYYYYWLALLFARRQRVAIQSGVNDPLVYKSVFRGFPGNFKGHIIVSSSGAQLGSAISLLQLWNSFLLQTCEETIVIINYREIRRLCVQM